MKVSKITYGMTRQPKGASKFQHDRVSVEMDLNPNDKFQDAVDTAKDLCLVALGHMSNKEFNKKYKHEIVMKECKR